MARKSLFYIDDVSLQAIEEPPLAVSTPLDEYYLGETIPWTVTAGSSAGRVNVQLLAPDRLVAGEAGKVETGPWHGTFESSKLKPGIHTLRATSDSPRQALQTAKRQIILAPDPFE